MKQEFGKPHEEWVDPFPEATAALKNFDFWMRVNYPDALDADQDGNFLPIATLINSGTVSFSWLYLHEWMTSKEQE